MSYYSEKDIEIENWLNKLGFNFEKDEFLVVLCVIDDFQYSVINI